MNFFFFFYSEDCCATWENSELIQKRCETPAASLRRKWLCLSQQWTCQGRVTPGWDLTFSGAAWSPSPGQGFRHISVTCNSLSQTPICCHYTQFLWFKDNSHQFPLQPLPLKHKAKARTELQAAPQRTAQPEQCKQQEARLHRAEPGPVPGSRSTCWEPMGAPGQPPTGGDQRATVGPWHRASPRRPSWEQAAEGEGASSCTHPPLRLLLLLCAWRMQIRRASNLNVMLIGTSVCLNQC